MKKIYAADIEADGLLDEITKIWCMSNAELDSKNKVEKSFTLTKMKDIAEMFSNPDNMLIMHNGIGYDGPAVEKVLKVKVRAEIVDTLYLSWYLNPKMIRHGLDPHGERLGIIKPKIDNWEDLTLNEYIHRCQEDVKIQTALWQEMWKHLMLLYGDKEGAWKAVRHLNWKAKQAAMQQKARWKLDIVGTRKLQELFTQKYTEAKIALEAAMPQVPVFRDAKRPNRPFKGNGELSAHGEKWKRLCKEYNKDFDDTSVEVIRWQSGLKEPNAGSPIQMKDWLFSLGWTPVYYDFKRHKETGDVRKIPQLKDKDTGNLCPNIGILARKTPALSYLRDMSVVKHRLGLVDGLLKNVSPDGYVVARIQGLTNTLRMKHKVAVNLPSTRKPWGKEIRGLFTARSEGSELCGSDMSSLEDRTKQHYMWVHDPEYVKEMMTPGFDPHLDMALAADLATEDDVAFYKAHKDKELKGMSLTRFIDISENMRHPGKTTNYAATYGAGGATIARAAGVSEAKGEILHAAYWSRNWSLTAIADNCIVKQSRGMKWLWNPVSGMWLFLRSDKDRFSTLNQSTGTYAFDRWVWYVIQARPQLTATFHDEVVLELKKGNREAMTKILKDAVDSVNKELKLNRDLDVDVDFGYSYAGIH